MFTGIAETLKTKFSVLLEGRLEDCLARTIAPRDRNKIERVSALAHVVALRVFSISLPCEQSASPKTLTTPFVLLAQTLEHVDRVAVVLAITIV